MNRFENIIGHIQEECAEVIQVCSKIKRFGIDNYHPRKTDSNREILVAELNDLFGTIAFLQDEGVVLEGLYSADAIEAKKEKIKHYMQYSKDKGLLED